MNESNNVDVDLDLLADFISGALDGTPDADALRRLFASPALRARLSAGAVEHASRFGWGSTVDRLLSVYRGAMSAQSEGRPALAG